MIANRKISLISFIPFTFFACCIPGTLFAEPSIVRLIQEEGKHQLVRNGQPYFVKGAGGSKYLDVLVKAGGNSIRTWGAKEDLTPLLDNAHSHGLTVTIGIWLGHERHGFNYQDSKAVTQQIEEAEAAFKKYKDHPALLMWGIGNEMEGEGNNPAVWYAVNHIARLAKEIDHNHPTISVIAELGGKKVENIHRFCPDVDIVGINTYGGIGSVGKRYLKLGGRKPYIVTEFGPPGQWETGTADWGAPHEMTSTRKALWYYDGYQDGILAHPDICLGSYVFVWGNKQEGTATWHGLFLQDGTRLGGVDAMTKAWGGAPLRNRCPEIQELKLSRDSGLKPGDTITAQLKATDPDKDALTVKWVLRHDSGLYGGGGDTQPEQTDFPDAIIESSISAAQVKLPEGGGSYRLFAYVYDGKGSAAVANQPLKAEGDFLPPKATFPLEVYSEGSQSGPYVPSGHMGNTGGIRMDSNCTQNPHSGKTCIEVSYSAEDKWAGVVWQSPAEDWGKLPGGLNLTGATHLEFWARGEQGGESVTFEFGILGNDAKFPDSGTGKLEKVELKKDWTQYRLNLKGLDLSCIKTGFAWVLAGQDRALKFFMDDVRYVKEK
ncbi:MAG: hypothetical protein O3B01_04145 [Planctomycetota bacterium]|nr:hypothetical protein [Planctomycetota bacterium]